MNSSYKYNIPQEGNGILAGESLSEHSSGCLVDSGGGNNTNNIQNRRNILRDGILNDKVKPGTPPNTPITPLSTCVTNTLNPVNQLDARGVNIISRRSSITPRSPPDQNSQLIHPIIKPITVATMTGTTTTVTTTSTTTANSKNVMYKPVSENDLLLGFQAYNNPSIRKTRSQTKLQVTGYDTTGVNKANSSPNLSGGGFNFDRANTYVDKRGSKPGSTPHQNHGYNNTNINLMDIENDNDSNTGTKVNTEPQRTTTGQFNSAMVQWQNDSTSKKKTKKSSQSTSKNETTSKRRVQETSPINGDSVKRSKTTFAVPTNNQFESLEQEQTNGPDEGDNIRPPKPEPIFITGVLKIGALKSTLDGIADSDEYSITTLRDGNTVKLLPKTIDTYKVIRSYLTENEISHYTYQLKSERAYRTVLRGLHHSEDTEDIKEKLATLGHETRNIVNVFHRTSKEPLPLFYVDLEPKQNNKEIFNIKYLNNMKVSFEPPYKKREIIQCKRCQRFGHTKNQCMRPYRCVKCGDQHPTAVCTKEANSEANCVNCEGKHPANFKGCLKYKQYRENILKLKPKKAQIQSNVVTPNNKPKTTHNSIHQKYNPSTTYADAVKTKQTTHNEGNRDVDQSNISNLMENMFNKIQQLMCSMIDNMMDRMIQLITTILPK